MSRLVAVLAGVGILVGLSARAVAQAGPSAPLASAKSLMCVFPVLATGTWTKGEARADVKASVLSFRFDMIDTDDGTARAVDAFGRVDITARLAGRALHLIQVFKDGPLYVTTVFDAESRPGKWKAVHTRHEYTDVVLPGFTSTPEQYYGECEVGR